jgi:hypothetical protein
LNLQLDTADLRPIVAAVVAEVLAEVARQPITADRLAYTEPEAAGLLGLKSHQLRDARLRGEIQATKVGGRIGYERTELLAYLARQRT